VGQLLGVCGLVVFVSMTALFAVALLRRDNSIADIAWGPGFLVVALTALLVTRNFTVRPLLATVLIAVWGLRLGVHIFLRNRERGEDFRYAAWRKAWGRWFIPRSYLQVFVLQGLFMLAVSFSVLVISHAPVRPLGLWDALGLGVWLVGFAFEAVGDRQLARFKKDPGHRGRIITDGLWRWTRHPNYFGEATMWWGLFLIALAVPGGAAAVVSPVTITVLLRWVSGVPLVERKYAGDEEFAAYARRTNAFFPWFPKKGGSEKPSPAA
jgi:steroid 5-alpha reductase family enzyme